MPFTKYIVWNENYSVGHEAIDVDHQRIISIINDLYTAIENLSVPQELKGLLGRLVEYTESHFLREERLMEKYLFPDLPRHKLVHDRMIQKTKDLCRRDLYQENRDDIATDALAFLKDWWLNHIVVMDSQYKPYLGGRAD